MSGSNRRVSALTVLFCSEWRTKTLYYACRNCDHQEPATGFCVYRNDLIHHAPERDAGRVDLASDPTLPRTSRVRCPRCSLSRAVFFNARERFSESAAMTLTFVCCNTSCNFQWTDTSTPI